MKLKLDENGNVVLQDGKPVYVKDDGTEVTFDAAGTTATINRLTGELKTTRQDSEKLKTTLAAFDGIDDPAAAKTALATVKNYDDKKLVDAGEVEKVKAEAIKASEEKYAPIIKERDDLQTQLHGELIGGGFARSQMIKDKISVPADMIQAQFGRNFKVEAGKVVAYDNNGNQIFSGSRPGELADFDEALEQLVNGYQFKDQILNGSKAGGGDFGGQKGSQGGVKASLADCKTEAEKIAYLKQAGSQD